MTTLEFILAVITLFTTGGGIASLFSFFQKHKKNKILENEIETLKDKKQDIEIIEIKDSIKDISKDIKFQNVEISSINAKLKDSEFLKKLDAGTNNFLLESLNLSEIKNDELEQALNIGQQKFILFAQRILFCDFKILPKEIKNTGKNLLRPVKRFIKIEKLEIKQDALFVIELQNYLIKSLDSFILNFSNYKNSINGTRRDLFNQALQSFFENIIQETLTLYLRDKK